MTLMVMLSMASISTLSALRAYVNGEGRWSKAESQAIADLRRYSVSGAETDYEKFRNQLNVLPPSACTYGSHHSKRDSPRHWELFRAE